MSTTKIENLKQLRTFLCKECVNLKKDVQRHGGLPYLLKTATARILWINLLFLIYSICFGKEISPTTFFIFLAATTVIAEFLDKFVSSGISNFVKSAFSGEFFIKFGEKHLTYWILVLFSFNFALIYTNIINQSDDNQNTDGQ